MGLAPSAQVQLERPCGATGTRGLLDGPAPRYVRLMARNLRPRASDQLPRQWTLFRLLQQAPAPGMGVRELATQLGAPKSNIERDLEALARAGFQLVQTTDPQHTQRVLWRAEVQQGPLQVPGFGPAELLSLYAAVEALHFLEGTPLHTDLVAVLHKVRAALAHSQHRATQRLARVFMAHPRDRVVYQAEDRRAILDDLMDAVARQRKVKVLYQSAGSGRSRAHVLLPLRLFTHHNVLYLLAPSERRDREVRTFAVHRIQELEVLKDGFRVPHTDLQAMAARAFGVFQEAPQDVEVVFSPDTARYVMEREFHPNETKQLLPDGGVLYRVRAGGRNEIVAWVLGFGGAARLVQPPGWREDLRVKAQMVLAAHGD